LRLCSLILRDTGVLAIRSVALRKERFTGTPNSCINNYSFKKDRSVRDYYSHSIVDLEPVEPSSPTYCLLIKTKTKSLPAMACIKTFLAVTAFLIFSKLIVAIHENGKKRNSPANTELLSLSDNSAPLILAYSDRISKEVCISMESAIFSDLEYHLIGAPLNTVDANPKFIKVDSLLSAITDFADGKLIMFADAFDVQYQGSWNKTTKLDLSKLMYNAETTCYPATHPHPSIYYCPLMQGHKYLQNRKHYEPRVCKMHRKRSPNNSSKSVYLNSGVMIGVPEVFKSIYLSVKELAKITSKLCREDQGLIQWLYLAKSAPIILDYESSLLASMFNVLEDYKFDTEKGLWTSLMTGSAPLTLHFNGDKSHFHHMWQTRKSWILKSNPEVIDRLKNATVKIYGVDRLFSEVCAPYV
jgi:hypothetical protein